jgi:uncharacterized membrane protein YfcA
MMMHWDILATIVVTATIQSLFGVGVLLFGTPVLLLLGYEFVTVLTILLPISLAINLAQVGRHRRQINRAFYKKILLLSIPFVILSLFLVTRTKIGLSPFIGLFLIVVALKGLWPVVHKLIDALTHYERAYFIVMGIIHGLTNLGGSLLTALVHHKHYPKDVTRVTTAASYGTFALFQLLTLLVTLPAFDLPVEQILFYMTTGLSVFFFMEHLVYARISAERYRDIFSIFLFLSGLALILKSWIGR